MILTYHGENFFRAQSGSFTVVSDSVNDRMKPDLSLKTISNPSQLGQFADSETKIIDTAGEYDIAGVHIKGFQVANESAAKFVKTIFTVRLEGFSLCFLGHLSESLDSSLIDKIGRIDILFLPVGDSPFLSPETASKIIKQLEPKIVIPAIHGKNAGRDLAKILDQEATVDSKLTVKFKELPEKGPKIFILNND